MADLCIAFDPSASLNKAFYTGEPFKLEWLIMEPEVIKVPKSGIEQYEATKIGRSLPEYEAWIEVGGEYYAVGNLAKKRFYAGRSLLTLKFETAVPKILAMVGAIAQTKKMPQEFSLSLGVLLPYGEYEDRKRFHETLKKALSNFQFRGKRYRVKLVAFDCLPEGGGLLMRGMDYKVNPLERDVLVIMVGYRNASFLLMEKGNLSVGETTKLGFEKMLEKVVESTSGLEASEIVKEVCAAGKRVKESALRPLVKSTRAEFAASEVKQIAKAVSSARDQYWKMLASWLEMKKFPPVDELIVAGGTAYYYKSELQEFFRGYQINWGQKLEPRIVDLVGESRWKSELAYRLTDVYGYFFYVQSLLKKREQQTA